MTWMRNALNSYPVCSTEVNSLSKVISLIEATVIGSRKRDDKLPSTLVGSYNLPKRNRTLSQKNEGGKKFYIKELLLFTEFNHVRLTGTPWDMRMLGFMMVTSWCRRSGWNSNSSGVSFFITSSSRSAATEGTPYHVLGSPLEKINCWLVWNRDSVHLGKWYS